MANRRLFQFRYSYERDLADVFALVTIGSTGAPTLTSGKGVASITRNSAGDYTLALTDSFNKLMCADFAARNATGISAAPNMSLKADSVNSATAPSIRFVCSTGGAATDPASGDVLYINLVCRNAST